MLMITKWVPRTFWLWQAKHCCHVEQMNTASVSGRWAAATSYDVHRNWSPTLSGSLCAFLPGSENCDCELSIFCTSSCNLDAMLRYVSHPNNGPVRAPGCKNRSTLFSGRMSYKATKPGCCLIYILPCLLLCCCLLGSPSMYGIVSFRWYVFCLLVVLVKNLSVLAKWLARKIPLKKPNHGEGSFP